MTTTAPGPDVVEQFRVGQLVEVRGADEIAGTLDDDGELESLPFMPEMLRHCGRRFRVWKIATKSCDTITRTGMRRMDNAVHLAGERGPDDTGIYCDAKGVRCDGSAHGGCQAECLIYWKTAWLRPVPEPQAPDLDDPPAIASPASPSADAPSAAPASPAEAGLLARLTATAHRAPAAQRDREDGDEDSDDQRYSCQATEMLRATPQQLPLRHFGQFVHDLRCRNAGPAATLRALSVGLFNRYQGISRRRLPRWLWLRGARPWGFIKGDLVKTPTELTNLQPGELVRIKSKDQIMATLNKDLLNRGLGFDPEMARFCGRTARVARRVTTILDETSGRILHMKNPCIVLEGVYCAGAYSANCPRAIPQYWREIWLERVEPRS